jgi:hypothetical protein
LRAQGYTGKIEAPSTVLTPNAIEEIGNTTNIQSAGCYSYDSQGYADFQASMARNQPSAQIGDEALAAWVGIKSFAKVMGDGSKELTRQGVLDAFNATTDLTTDGLRPPIDFTKETGVEGFTRAFSPTAVNHEITDGKQVDVKPTTFLNVLTGEVAAAD